MILISQSISDGVSISYLLNSYTAYGNDGNHFNDSINAPPNTAVGQEIADAIHYASDHLPLFASFTFEPMQSITVLIPNGGEYWVIGNTYQVEWTSENVDFVKMFLTTDNGFSWELFAENVTSSDGSYDFDVPIITSNQCKIKIVDESNDLTFDESDSVFTIDIFVSVEDYFGDGIPTEYNLNQNFPNPFNPTTTISYSIPKEGLVTIKIYNAIGEEVVTVVNEIKQVGNYEIQFNAAALPSGIYFYRIQAGSFVETKKMILLK